MNNRDARALQKILDEIRYLETSAAGVSFDAFMGNETLRRAVAMTLINIGELARLLSEELKAGNPDIPFNEIIATRNIAAHGYKTLRFDDIWNTVATDIPDLKRKIASIL
ncbi:MAG: DUF86 domain-containing protein [Clostridiales bacterium]|jgi:uncharacterized protein with HEPN domain|nr:DUF86 domain-containing protein [Clostridiales bacterium]